MSATYWKEIEDKQLLPDRKAESMRNFLKVSLKYGLKVYMQTNIEKSAVKYAHNFANIPKVKNRGGSLSNEEE
jgi:hypothetical protein